MKKSHSKLIIGILTMISFKRTHFLFFFCIILIPLSIELKNKNYRCKTTTEKINYQFYMNDLKLYAKNHDDLEGLLSAVKRLSDDIRIQFEQDIECNKQSYSNSHSDKSFKELTGRYLK